MRVLAVLLSAWLLPACSSAPSEPADALLARGLEIYRSAGPKDAVPHFTRALEEFRRAGDRSGEARALSALGNAAKASGDNDGAIRLLRQAVSLHQSLGVDSEVGKAWSNLGLAYHAAARYEEATAAFGEALALAARSGDRRLEAAVHNNSGLVRDEVGEYRQALQHYERALSASREIGFERLTSDALGNIGGVHLLLGRYREASSRYREAYAISERLGLGPGMSKDLGNLAASLLGAGEVREALRAYDRALVLAREGGLATDEADWELGRGRVLLRLGDYDDALAAYESALRLYESADLPRERVDALLERGALLLSMGSDDAAQKDFNTAADLAARIGYTRGTNTARLALGDLESRRRRFDDAVRAYTASMDGARAAGELAILAEAQVMLGRAYLASKRFVDAAKIALEARAAASQLRAPEVEARALHLLAAVARAEARNAEGLDYCRAAAALPVVEQTPELRWRQAYEQGRLLEQSGDLPSAVTALSRAVATLEEIREDLRDDRFRGGYLLDKQEAYASLVRVLVRLGRAEAALEEAERLRTPPTSLRPALESARAAELRRRIQKLQREREAETTRPLQAQRRAALAVFSDEITAAQQEYAREVGRVGQISRPSSGTWTASTIRRALPAATAILAFVVGEEASTVFVLTRGGVTAALIPVGGRDLQTRIELLRDLLERPEDDAWVRPASALREMLIPAALLDSSGIARLAIVPNGVLHYLPFAVLPLPGPAGKLLLDRFELTYTPAASMLVAGGERRRQNGLFALAPAAPGLTHTAAEVQRLSRLRGDATTLVGQRATESAFKASAGRFGVLHLATHGFFNRANPLFSGVVLEAGGDEDGRLEVHEILRLPLHASLVTLSACRTGLGGGQMADIPPGDDFVGLTRAFLTAGTDAVLATLWDLHDEAAVSLMTDFYGRLDADGAPAALRAAQRKLRDRQGRFSHPFYWAGLVLVTARAEK
jgi:CHAT domain-containing protein